MGTPVEVDNIKNVTVVGIGTQGSMIAFRNALYGKQVTGYSRTEKSILVCQAKVEKWLAYFVQEGRIDVTAKLSDVQSNI